MPDYRKPLFTRLDKSVWTWTWTRTWIRNILDHFILKSLPMGQLWQNLKIFNTSSEYDTTRINFTKMALEDYISELWVLFFYFLITNIDYKINIKTLIMIANKIWAWKIFFNIHNKCSTFVYCISIHNWLTQIIV